MLHRQSRQAVINTKKIAACAKYVWGPTRQLESRGLVCYSVIRIQQSTCVIAVLHSAAALWLLHGALRKIK